MTATEPAQSQRSAALQQRLAELEATAQRYASLFEDAGDAIYIADPATFAIIEANAAASRRLGYTREELLALTLDDIEVLPEDDQAHMLSAWESSFSGARTYECHYRHKDGVLLPVEVTSRVVETGERQILQIAARDISKRKTAEIAVRTANERLSILQQIDVELALKLDVGYVCMRALDAAIRLSGAENGVIALTEGDNLRVVQAMGDYYAKIGAFLPQDSGIVGRVARQQQPEMVLDVHADPDYAPFIAATRAQMTLPLRSRQRLVGILSLETVHPDRFSADLFDFVKLLSTRTAVAIDNAHAYEEQVKLAQELEAFAHTVAHDLKNPLNNVLGYACMLADDAMPLAAEQTQEFAATIANSSRKMNNIINELLLLASVRKLDKVETTPLAMGQVVHEALSRFSLMIDEYQAEIIVPDDWPEAVGYAGWVEEVWANYISNALKYGGTPPRVTMGATRQADGMVRFWVQDNGPGIPPAQQARLFSQFTRLDETRAQGHGLGLSIVQRIVEKLGGQVRVESESGAGSVFSFTLPAH